MAVKENKKVKKADKVLERISKDPRERERYEAILKAEFNQRISNQKFEEKGEARGKVLGERNKQIEIAKKMLNKNKPIEEIMEFTGLTEEEINELK